MHTFHAHADPPSLPQRLERLTDTLEGLREQVKEAIARAVSAAVADAVRDAVTSLLGLDAPEAPHERCQGFFGRSNPWSGPQEADPWHDDGWGVQDEADPASSHPKGASRTQVALGAALQAGLWWLRQRPVRRPVLVASLVAGAVGLAALITGPSVTATVTTGAVALASALGLLATAETARSAAASLSHLLGDPADTP